MLNERQGQRMLPDTYRHPMLTLRRRARVVRPVTDRSRGPFDAQRAKWQRKSRPKKPKLFSVEMWNSCDRCGGRAKGKSWSICNACDQRKQHAGVASLLRRAEWLAPEEWQDWVYSDGHSYNEGYFDGVCEMLEIYAEDECKPPAFVATCTTSPPRICIEGALERVLTEEMWDGAEYDDLADIDELWAFVEKWNAKQKSTIITPDWSRIVVLDAARTEKFLAFDHNGLPNTRYYPQSSFGSERLDTERRGAGKSRTSELEDER